MNNDRQKVILHDIIWYVRYMSKLYLLCPKNDITVYICWRRKKVALGYSNFGGAGIFKFVGARSWGPAFLLVDCCCFEYNLGIKNLQHNPFHSKSICTKESENYNYTLQAQLSCCIKRHVDALPIFGRWSGASNASSWILNTLFPQPAG